MWVYMIYSVGVLRRSSLCVCLCKKSVKLPVIQILITHTHTQLLTLHYALSLSLSLFIFIRHVFPELSAGPTSNTDFILRPGEL